MGVAACSRPFAEQSASGASIVPMSMTSGARSALLPVALVVTTRHE